MNNTIQKPQESVTFENHEDHPKRSLLAGIAFALLIVIGVAGFLLRMDAAPVYNSTATIELTNRSIIMMTGLSDPRRSNSITRAVAPGGVKPCDGVVFKQEAKSSDQIDVIATAQGAERSAEMANSAAQLMVLQDRRASMIAMRRMSLHPTTAVSAGIAQINEYASADKAAVSPYSPSTPSTYGFEMGGFGLAAVLGLVGLVGLGIAKLAQATHRRMPENISTSEPEPVKPPAPHTLIVVSLANPADEDSTDTSSEPLLDVKIDDVLIQRLNQYKAHSPNAGCVLLVTRGFVLKKQRAPEMVTPGTAASVLEIAEQLSLTYNKSTLVIDTGSQFWSGSREDAMASREVVQLPAVPGVYDILKGLATLDDCILTDDDAPGFRALAAGKVPKDWPELLRSSAMQDLIKASRTYADLVIVYGPPCLDRAETVRVVGQWTNGVMIAGLEDPSSDDAAIDMLQKLDVKMFGRIELRSVARSKG